MDKKIRTSSSSRSGGLRDHRHPALRPALPGVGFPSLPLAKNISGQRIYRRRDIETVLRIKQLLYEEGFTIAGAKKRLEAEMAGRVETPIPAADGPTVNPPDAGGADRVAALRQVREQLREILTPERNDRTRV
jgi:DNA-binding transcriptional MerR regulator